MFAFRYRFKCCHSSRLFFPYFPWADLIWDCLDLSFKSTTNYITYWCNCDPFIEALRYYEIEDVSAYSVARLAEGSHFVATSHDTMCTRPDQSQLSWTTERRPLLSATLACLMLNFILLRLFYVHIILSSEKIMQTSIVKVSKGMVQSNK